MSFRAAIVCIYRASRNVIESVLNFLSIPGVVSKVNLVICVGGSILCFAPIYFNFESNLEDSSFAHLIRTSRSFRDASIASIALVIPNLLDVISDFVFVSEDQVLTATLAGIDRFEKLFFSIGVMIPSLVIIARDGLMKPTLVFVCALNCRDCLLFCIMIAFLSRHYSSSWTPARSIWITLLFALSQIVNSFALNNPSGNLVSPSTSTANDMLPTAQQTLLWFSLLPFLITGFQWCYRIYLQSSNPALMQRRQSSGAAVIYLLSASSYILFSTWLAFRHVAEGKIDQFSLVASTFGYMTMTLCFLLLNLRRNKHEIVKGFDALNSKQTFLRYLSDEIKTPLRAVSYGMDQVSTKLELEEQSACAKDIQHLKNGCDSVLRVLDALVQFDKVHDGLLRIELSTQPFLPIVEQTLASFAAQAVQKNIQLQMVLKDEFGNDRINLERAITDIDELREFNASVDRERIAHVIWNLLSNALKYTPRGGKVTVVVGIEEHAPHRRFDLKYDFNFNQILNRRYADSGGGGGDGGSTGLLRAADGNSVQSSPAMQSSAGTSTDDVRSVNLRAGGAGTGAGSLGLLPAHIQRRMRGKRHFTVDVIDNGMGISMENQGKIFVEPVQMSVGNFEGGGGAGLGLYISKGIVDLHKGKLTVKSNGIGTGSTFSLRLPIVEDAVQRGGSGAPRGRRGSFSSDTSEALPDAGTSVDVLNHIASQLATSTISFLLPDNKDDDDDSDEELSDPGRRMSLGNSANTNHNPLMSQFTLGNFNFTSFRSLSMARRTGDRLSGESPSRDLELGEQAGVDDNGAVDTAESPRVMLAPNSSSTSLLITPTPVEKSSVAASLFVGDTGEEEEKRPGPGPPFVRDMSPSRSVKKIPAPPPPIGPPATVSVLAVNTPLPINSPIKSTVMTSDDAATTTDGNVLSVAPATAASSSSSSLDPSYGKIPGNVPATNPIKSVITNPDKFRPYGSAISPVITPTSEEEFDEATL